MNKYLIIYFKWVMMWACDIVPWVSGGTIAFISGIYETLINTIASFDKQAFQLFINKQRKTLRSHINGNFLISLLAGITTSILTLASFIWWALDYHTAIIYSFFIWLILASVVLVVKKVNNWNYSSIIAIIIGTWLWLLIINLSPTTVTTPTWRMIMGAAAIAICAMILPWISWSFLLLLMGMYTTTLDALHAKDISYIILFIWWVLIGILSFVRIVRWTFTHYHDITTAWLIGLMLWSLPLLFPRNIETPNTSTWLLRCGIWIVWFLFVWWLEFIAKQKIKS